MGDAEDEVRLYEDGWKERYFRTKFDVSADDSEFRRKVVASYVEGLAWVLSYYYQGVQDWSWYYPFHYAPFASDFTDLTAIEIKWDRAARPRKPLEQLMCVFPAASGQFLPKTWHTLMKNPESQIIDMYPTDFAVDMNGKKFEWMGVVLLPFLDDERQRNKLGNNILMVSRKSKIYPGMRDVYEKGMSLAKMSDQSDALIEAKDNHGIQGSLKPDMGYVHGETFLQSPGSFAPDLTNNFVVSCVYEDPVYPNDYVFKAQMLPGAKLPDTTLKPKCFGDNANRGSRDWSQRNHQSGAHIGPGGQRMMNQGRGGKKDCPSKAPLHFKLSRRERQVIRQRRMLSGRNARKNGQNQKAPESESETESSESESESASSTSGESESDESESSTDTE